MYGMAFNCNLSTCPSCYLLPLSGLAVSSLQVSLQCGNPLLSSGYLLLTALAPYVTSACSLPCLLKVQHL